MHYSTLFQDKNFLERGTAPLQTLQRLDRRAFGAPHLALSLSFMRPVFTTELCRKLTVKIYRTPQSKILATPMFLHILKLT